MTPNERVGRILWVGTPVGAILGTLLYYYLEDQKKIQKLPEVVRGAHTVRCPLSSERLALSLARHSPCLPFSVCAIANFCKRGRAQVLASVRAGGHARTPAACTHARPPPARTHARPHARPPARTHGRTCPRTHARTHAQSHTHTHTHTHAHAHAHAHTRTRGAGGEHHHKLVGNAHGHYQAFL